MVVFMNSECKNLLNRNRIKRFCSVLLVLAILLLAGCQKKMTVQDYLDLGEKYLTEAKYEEAIVAFGKVIELEPKVMKAYEGLASAYVKTENYEKAQKVLQSGISVYEGLAEAEKTDEWKQIYEALLKMQEEVSAYLDTESSPGMGEENAALSEADSAAEQERLAAEAKEKYGSILEQVADEINSQEPTISHYFTDDFQSFVKSLEKPLVWKREDGNYLGLYVGTDGAVYVYLGEMENGQRSGFGSWYGEYDSGSELFYGSWSDDYPNGTGTYLEKTQEEDGFLRNERQGNYKDGYEDGTINWKDTCPVYDGATNRAYEGALVNSTGTYDVERGIPHILYVEDGLNVVSEGSEDWQGSEESCLLSYDDGDIWGVNGAMKN